MYIFVSVMMLTLLAVGLLLFLIWDKIIDPKQQTAKRHQRIRDEILARETEIAKEKDRKEWVQTLLREMKEEEARKSELDDTIIVPFVRKEYWDDFK